MPEQSVDDIPQIPEVINVHIIKERSVGNRTLDGLRDGVSTGAKITKNTAKNIKNNENVQEFGRSSVLACGFFLFFTAVIMVAIIIKVVNQLMSLPSFKSNGGASGHYDLF